MASRPYALVRRVDVHEFDGIRLIDDEPYVRLRDGTLVPMVRQEAGTGEPIDEWVR